MPRERGEHLTHDATAAGRNFGGRARIDAEQRGAREPATIVVPMHVGLNLIFLVPGETGGMEIAARELITALVEVAPEVRFTAFVNREAADARDEPWGDVIP